MLSQAELLEFQNKLKCELSLHEFLRQAWSSIEGDLPFVDNWHLQVISEHLELCYKREIRNLLINISPRCAKTTLVSICFPVWCFIKDPSLKFMFASYAKSLSLEHAVKARRLIESDWFQNNWGDRFKLTSDQNTKGFYQNDSGGYRISTSVGAASLGSGADLLICDDPNAGSASQITRIATNDWYSQTWSTRLNDQKTGVRITIMQRLAEDDLSGHILVNDLKREVVHLCLPMEFDSKRRCSTVVIPSSYPNVWTDPRQLEGALMFPKRFGPEQIRNLKQQLGSYAYSNQFQQLSAPAEGGILQRKWFKIYNESKLPVLTHIIQSYDTAYSDKPTAAYSACSTFGVFEENGIVKILLLSCWRGRLNYTDLRARAKRLYNNYFDIGESLLTVKGMKVDYCIIENKATGPILIQDFREAGIPAVSYQPKGDKKARIQQVSAYMEAGIVQILNKPENMEFLNEICLFPNANTQDYADTLSQILGYLRDNNMLKIPKDPAKRETKIDFKPENRYFNINN